MIEEMTKKEAGLTKQIAEKSDSVWKKRFKGKAKKKGDKDKFFALVLRGTDFTNCAYSLIGRMRDFVNNYFDVQSKLDEVAEKR